MLSSLLDVVRQYIIENEVPNSSDPMVLYIFRFIFNKNKGFFHAFENGGFPTSWLIPCALEDYFPF